MHVGTSHAVQKWSRPQDSADVQRPACMFVSAACRRLGHSASQQASTRRLTEISHCKTQGMRCDVLCPAKAPVGMWCRNPVMT